MALAEVVLDGPLLCTCGLNKGNGASEGTGERLVLDLGDADVAGASNVGSAGHASGHLDLDGEVLDRGARETTDANAGNVLGHLGFLEGGRVGAARGAVDGSGQGASTILVDLVEGHGDGAVVGAGGHARGGASAGSLGNTFLSSALGGLRALLVGLLGVGTGSGHEHLDGGGGVDGASALSAAKSGRLVGSELALADDGCVSLRAAGWGSAVTRSAVDDYGCFTISFEPLLFFWGGGIK